MPRQPLPSPINQVCIYGCPHHCLHYYHETNSGLIPFPNLSSVCTVKQLSSSYKKLQVGYTNDHIHPSLVPVISRQVFSQFGANRITLEVHGWPALAYLRPSKAFSNYCSTKKCCFEPLNALIWALVFCEINLRDTTLSNIWAMKVQNLLTEKTLISGWNSTDYNQQSFIQIVNSNIPVPNIDSKEHQVEEILPLTELVINMYSTNTV